MSTAFRKYKSVENYFQIFINIFFKCFMYLQFYVVDQLHV